MASKSRSGSKGSKKSRKSIKRETKQAGGVTFDRSKSKADESDKSKAAPAGASGKSAAKSGGPGASRSNAGGSKRALEWGGEGHASTSAIAELLISALAKAADGKGAVSTKQRESQLAELERKKEARAARQARESRDRELGSLAFMDKSELEMRIRRQIHAIDAGAFMALDTSNPAEAALAAILHSVMGGGGGNPVIKAMRAILESVTGTSSGRHSPQAREFMQHVLDKATGLLDVDPDSDVGKALNTLVETVMAGHAESVVAAQIALKGALESALKVKMVQLPSRLGEAAVGHLIASDVLEMALLAVDEALLSGRAKLILREAKEMHRRGEDIWTYMMRLQFEASQFDQRWENIRRWKRMGGITQVPWTPTKRRGPIAAEYQSPGPACVALPNLIGGSSCIPDSKRQRAPAFSFGSRHGGKNESPGPGPGQYNVTGLSAKGKDNPPASSLHSRPKDFKSDQTPAPGDYNPEKSEKVVHDNSPKYTFGLKTVQDKPSSTPAPNVYNIPTVLGATKEGNKKQAPAFTISGRQKDKPDDRVYNPGPGSYNNAKADNYKMRSPAYSISSRYQMPSDATLKPGPGAHSPEKVYLNQRWAPNYSFGIKHSKFKGDKGFVLVTERPRPTYACTC